jgi:signal transduction histidine kinase
MMKLGTIAVVCAVSVTTGLLSGCGPGESPGKSAVVALVDKAVALVERDGEKAFAEFRKKDSEWFQGDVYIFVDDLDGVNLCHPVKPDLEGKNLLDMKDAHDKLFVREMVELLKTKDAGWVEYGWPKPGETKPSKKLGYVRKAKLGAKTVLVGSGIYAD